MKLNYDRLLDSSAIEIEIQVSSEDQVFIENQTDWLQLIDNQ